MARELYVVRCELLEKACLRKLLSWYQKFSRTKELGTRSEPQSPVGALGKAAGLFHLKHRKDALPVKLLLSSRSEVCTSLIFCL